MTATTVKTERQVRHLQAGDTVVVDGLLEVVKAVWLPSHRGQKARVTFLDGRTVERWGDDLLEVCK